MSSSSGVSTRDLRVYTRPIRYHSSGIFSRSNPLYGRNSMSESLENPEDSIAGGFYIASGITLEKDSPLSRESSSSA